MEGGDESFLLSIFYALILTLENQFFAVNSQHSNHRLTLWIFKIIYEAYTIVYHKFIKDYKKIPLDEALKKIKIDDEKAKYFVKKAKSFKINEEGTFEAFLQILEEIDFYKNPPFSFIKPIFPQPIEEIDDD